VFPVSRYDPGMPDDVPEMRSYVHSRCGEVTGVDGHDFAALADPLSHPDRTFCVTCEAVFPVAEFRWHDTDEALDAYHARHAARFSAGARLVGGRRAGLAFAAVGLVVCGAAALWATGGLGVVLRVVIALVAAVVGAVAGLLVWDGVLKPAVVRGATGVADCRALP